MPDSLGGWVLFVGSPVAMGAVVSFALDWSPFIALSGGKKVALLMLACIAMGVFSHLVITYVPASVLEAAQPYYAIIVQAVAALGGAKLWHAAFGRDTDSTPPGTKG